MKSVVTSMLLPALLSVLVLFTLMSFRVQAGNSHYSDDVTQHRAAYTNNNHGEDGVKFSCSIAQLNEIDQQMSVYFIQLGINATLIQRQLNPQAASLLFTLATPPNDFSTLNFRSRPEMQIRDQLISLPSAGGSMITVLTVSEKEIVLALMQHGRLTEFSGEQCNAETFIDHVKIRQNTVAWAELLEWGWPDGGKAKWNKKYWNKGTPLRGVSPSVAVADAFENQNKYSIGCYTATKLVMVQGILDYYHRIKKSPHELARVERRLMADGEPLVNIEPRAFWFFEEDFDANRLWENGKLLEMRYNIPPRNFVPGDWGYILNTDPKTKNKIGYEGSNAIYLGRGQFDDYYNDHNHSYLLREKLDEVYQWRNKVFSRSRDIDKVLPLTEGEMNALESAPDQGGLIMDTRAFFMISPSSSETLH
ncbi:hypothetical protein [Solimicrobium silvestre]|uniref:Uncharacterized protein n=1 Tax=Solimicrobium silvestre TaxID=2099400 RepID=A0A2S9GX76_9BURK|nr:hypothetical protein [Solimicrobium silvestre]PRC92322.1 hypothetical protein S2091_2981 [Solimicrobium silvestre]